MRRGSSSAMGKSCAFCMRLVVPCMSHAYLYGFIPAGSRLPHCKECALAKSRKKSVKKRADDREYLLERSCLQVELSPRFYSDNGGEYVFQAPRAQRAL